MSDDERPSNRAATISAASWALVASCCFYLGRFTPSHEGFEIVGRRIDERLSGGGEHWSLGIGSALWSVIRNLPEDASPIGDVDEVELDDDSDDYDYDDYDDHNSDDEVIMYE